MILPGDVGRTTKPKTRLITISTTMPRVSRRSRRDTTNQAPNRPKMAPGPRREHVGRADEEVQDRRRRGAQQVDTRYRVRPSTAPVPVRRRQRVHVEPDVQQPEAAERWPAQERGRDQPYHWPILHRLLANCVQPQSLTMLGLATSVRNASRSGNEAPGDDCRTGGPPPKAVVPPGGRPPPRRNRRTAGRRPPRAGSRDRRGDHTGHRRPSFRPDAGNRWAGFLPAGAADLRWGSRRSA